MNRDDSVGNRCSEILQEALRLLAEAPAAFLIYLLVMVGAGALVDVYSAGPGALFGLNAAGIFADFGLTMAIVTTSVRGGRRGRRGALTYLGILILSGLAYSLGLLLLVVPGLILWARWSPVYGYALGDGRGVIEAMGESWEATRGHTLPILLALLLPFALPICVAIVMLAARDEVQRVPLVTAIFTNGLIYLGAAVGIAVGLAVFSLLARQDSEVAEVFE